MAIVRSNRSPENESEATAVTYLQQHLPDDYLIIPNVQLADARNVPEIDLVIIKDNAIITAEVKGWYGRIAGSAFGDTVRVGPMQQRNPVRQADKQAKRLAGYLRQPAQAEAVFGDARVGYCLYVMPIVIFTNPRAKIEIQSQESVKLLHLAEVADCITQADFGRKGCQITLPERERMARLLLNEPLGSAIEAEKAAPPAESRVEAEAPVEMEIVKDLTEVPVKAVPVAESVSDDTVLSSDRGSSPRFVHVPATSPGNDDMPTASIPARPAPGVGQTVKAALTGLFYGALNVGDTLEDKMGQFEDKRLLGHRGEQPLKSSRLARSLEGELERTLRHLIKEVIACNNFTVSLSPRDYAHYAPFKETCEQELTDHLQNLAESRDYRLLAPVHVELLADDLVSPGTCQVKSEIARDIKPTIVKPWLEIPLTGDRFVLDKEVITIGRHNQNDIFVGELDKRQVISRRHAQLRRENGQFVLYDGQGGQQSSSGTYVEGERLSLNEGRALQDKQGFVLGPTQRRNSARPLQGSLMFVFHTGAPA